MAQGGEQFRALFRPLGHNHIVEGLKPLCNLRRQIGRIGNIDSLHFHG